MRHFRSVFSVHRWHLRCKDVVQVFKFNKTPFPLETVGGGVWGGKETFSRTEGFEKGDLGTSFGERSFEPKWENEVLKLFIHFFFLRCGAGPGRSLHFPFSFHQPISRKRLISSCSRSTCLVCRQWDREKISWKLPFTSISPHRV